jgi:hypothetical protein
MAGFISAPVALADSFSLTDVITTITFTLPASPTPSFFQAGGSFEIDGVSLQINGASDTANLFFYSAPSLGGLAITDANGTLLNQQGGVVYSGTEASPTFFTGVYLFNNLALPDNSNPIYAGNFAMTVTPPLPTPEPSSILLVGLGLIGLSGAVLLCKKTQRPSSGVAPAQVSRAERYLA